ncbi:excalibur calcium-binding domain-containing protein [Rheinheimera marina]|uniref:Excalibur calcium-binding domain-containing protein n=1 Tax=Rheinheimera marina TaxID=1774958 RepID=A0ABV9JHB1_9GAMM
MKKTLGFTLLVVMGWLYYQTTLIKQATVPPVVELPVVEPVPAAELDYQPVTAPSKALPKPQPPIKTIPQSARFVCDGRQYCSQMRSRAEAEYFLRNCPNTKMDGDRDGIPCENDSRF